MRRPRLRFTIRWLMLAVALAGLAAGIIALRQRRAAFLARAARAAWDERYWYGDEELMRKEADKRRERAASQRSSWSWKNNREAYIRVHKSHGVPTAEDLDAEADDYDRKAEESRRLVDWNAVIRARYTRAADYPWLPVQPDPTKPKEPERWAIMSLEPHKSSQP